MFHKVLFPVDFSERCRLSAPYVASVARSFKSELTLLHAFNLHDPFGYGATSSTVASGESLDTVKASHKCGLAEFGLGDFAGLPSKRVMEFGEPAECIARYAADYAIDLIVMPTHGGGRFRRLLLGSITAKVLHDTDCSLWTMTHSGPLSVREIHTVVCAVNLDLNAVRLIRAAARIAAEYGADVRLAHAVSLPDADASGTGDMSLERFLFDTARRQIAARQEEAGTHFETFVKAGNVPGVVREAALHFDAGLVITGRGRLQDFLGPFRSNAYETIRESPCPVLSLAQDFPRDNFSAATKTTF